MKIERYTKAERDIFDLVRQTMYARMKSCHDRLNLSQHRSIIEHAKHGAILSYTCDRDRLLFDETDGFKPDPHYSTPEFRAVYEDLYRRRKIGDNQVFLGWAEAAV